MGDVIELFSSERYCLSKQCRRVDCENHCWGCGLEHAHEGISGFPFCLICDIELDTDEDIDLTGFWDPSRAVPVKVSGRRKRKYTKESLDDVLRTVGQDWLKDYLDSA